MLDVGSRGFVRIEQLLQPVLLVKYVSELTSLRTVASVPLADLTNSKELWSLNQVRIPSIVTETETCTQLRKRMSQDIHQPKICSRRRV